MIVGEMADADVLGERAKKELTYPRARTRIGVRHVVAGATPDENGSSNLVPGHHSRHDQKLSVILFSGGIFRGRAVWLRFHRHDCRHRRLVDGILFRRSLWNVEFTSNFFHDQRNWTFRRMVPTVSRISKHMRSRMSSQMV